MLTNSSRIGSGMNRTTEYVNVLDGTIASDIDQIRHQRLTIGKPVRQGWPQVSRQPRMLGIIGKGGKDSLNLAPVDLANSMGDRLPAWLAGSDTMQKITQVNDGRRLANRSRRVGKVPGQSAAMVEGVQIVTDHVTKEVVALVVVVPDP